MESQAIRVYRHDAEGYIWIWTLSWICLRYDGEKRIPHPAYLWAYENLEVANNAKLMFPLSFKTLQPLPRWEPLWELACKLVEAVTTLHLACERSGGAQVPLVTRKMKYPSVSSPAQDAPKPKPKPGDAPKMSKDALDLPPHVEYQLVWEVGGVEGFAHCRSRLGLPLDPPELPKVLQDVLSHVLTF